MNMRQRGFILPSHALVMAGVIIVALSLSNVLFFNFWQGAKDDYANYRAEVRAAQQALADEAERVRVESAQISRDTAAGWAAAVDYWRKRPVAVRVLPSANGCLSEGGAVSTAIPGLDVATAQYGLGAGRDETTITFDQCEARINNAVLDAAQVLHLQHWITEQHEVSR